MALPPKSKRPARLPFAFPGGRAPPSTKTRQSPLRSRSSRGCIAHLLVDPAFAAEESGGEEGPAKDDREEDAERRGDDGIRIERSTSMKVIKSARDHDRSDREDPFVMRLNSAIARFLSVSMPIKGRRSTAGSDTSQRRARSRKPSPGASRPLSRSSYCSASSPRESRISSSVR